MYNEKRFARNIDELVLSMKKLTFRMAFLGLASVMSAAAIADLTPYSQNFENLTLSDTAALTNDGWLVFGNVFESNGDYVYGYGTFPAPNAGNAFCSIASGEAGAAQGQQYLNVFSDYNNGDHANNRRIESNVFQERVVGASNLGKTYKFTFDYKASSMFGPAGQTTAAAFIKVLDPTAGYALVAFPTVSTTTASTSAWTTASITITIDNAWTGNIFQIGFMNTATNYEASGVYYDNINFAEVASLSGTVNLSNYSVGADTKTVDVDIYSADGTTLLESFTNVSMSANGEFSVAHNQPAGTYDIYVKADHWLRKLVDNVSLAPSGSIGSVSLVNGDVNGDNEVGPADFSLLSSAFGSTDGDPNWNALADLDGDGEVGPSDFSVLSGSFGESGD